MQGSHSQDSSTLGGEATITVGAGEGTHSLVAEVMSCQLRTLAEGAATYVTQMCKLIAMDEHVSLEDARLRKLLGTDRAPTGQIVLLVWINSDG